MSTWRRGHVSIKRGASAPQVNARFVPATFVMGGTCTYCTRKTVFGSFVKSVYITALTLANKLTARVTYHADTPSRANVAVYAEDVEGALYVQFAEIKCKIRRDLVYNSPRFYTIRRDHIDNSARSFAMQ